jgi:DNA-binding NtrC family response regulator
LLLGKNNICGARADFTLFLQFTSDQAFVFGAYLFDMVVPVLAIDDDPKIHSLLDRIMQGGASGYSLAHAGSPAQAEAMIAASSYAIALVDLHFEGESRNGFSLLQHLRDADPGIELVVLSSSNSFDDVREAMRSGATDYLPKGFGRGELMHALEQAVQRRRWRRMEREVRGRAENSALSSLLGKSAEMSLLRERIRKFGPAEPPVLISGETGTGKELVASSLHACGKDPAGPFVPVNCAALPVSTVDAFFFGHERGAFTGAERSREGVFEEADGGTLFLDEVNSLPFDLQGRLLRVLQEKRVRRLGSGRELPVDFRLVAASNQALEMLVEKGQFREDLFFRLNVLRLSLPPLRERLEDLPDLCGRFAPDRKLREDLLGLFRLHSWPGNVRELRNLLVAMDVIAPPGEPLSIEHLPEQALKTFASSQVAEEVDLVGFVNETESREKEFLARAYRGAGGNVSKMARLLTVDRSHLHQKLVRLGIHQSKSK